MAISVEGFDWDEGTQQSVKSMIFSLEEIEEFFHGQVFVAPDLKHSQNEERFLAVGRSSSGKPMFVAFTLRDNLIRPISAQYMHEKEARQYEKIFTQDNE